MSLNTDHPYFLHQGNHLHVFIKYDLNAQQKRWMMGTGARHKAATKGKERLSAHCKVETLQ